MNIKSFLLLTLIALFADNSLYAYKDSLQEHSGKNRWSIGITGGYGFSATNDVLGWSRINDGQNNITEKQVRGTFGEGLFSTLVVGLRVHKNITVELGGFANFGGEIKTNYLGSQVVPDQYQETYKKVRSQGVVIGIGIADTIGKFEIGLQNFLVCGAGNAGLARTIQAWSNNVYETHWSYSERTSWGWLGRVSFSYLLCEHFVTGINGFVMLHSWSPGKAELIYYTYNDQDMLSTVPEEQRTIIYSDNMTYSSVGPAPTGQGFSFSYPLSVFGAEILFKYNF